MGHRTWAGPGCLECIRLFNSKAQTSAISEAASGEAERTQSSPFGSKTPLCLSGPLIGGQRGAATLFVQRWPHPRSTSPLLRLRISCSSLDSHQGKAKFCSAIHIQGSMLMRIIIKQCRVGTSSGNLLSRRRRQGRGRESEKQLCGMLFWTWFVLVTFNTKQSQGLL